MHKLPFKGTNCIIILGCLHINNLWGFVMLERNQAMTGVAKRPILSHWPPMNDYTGLVRGPYTHVLQLPQRFGCT